MHFENFLPAVIPLEAQTLNASTALLKQFSKIVTIENLQNRRFSNVAWTLPEMFFFSAKKLWSDLWRSNGYQNFFLCGDTFELSSEKKIMSIDEIFMDLWSHEVE